MSRSRLAWWLCVGTSVLAAPAPAAAQTSPRGAFPPSATANQRAVVVIVADSGGPALEALLLELLRRRDIEPTFVEQSAFDREQLLGDGGASDAQRSPVWVFVVARSNRSARLYFRAPGADRFLLRDVALRDGLDELGRELVGQVVESGVDALLNEGAGMTRAEARAALEREGPEPAREKPPLPPVPPVSRAPPGPAERRQPAPNAESSSVAGWIAVRYEAAWSGSALGLGNGPGLELGVGLGHRIVARARVSGALHWPEQLDTPRITAHLATSSWRAGADVGVVSGPNAWLASVGAGQDFTRVDPSAKAGSGIEAASPTHASEVVARAELRFETGGSRFRFAVIGFADVGLADTHYDIADSSGVRRLAEPWAVEPGLALALGCRL